MTTPTIALLVNPLNGQEYNLQRYCVSIGREIGNDIVLASDRTISRQHALIHALNDKHFLEDLNSKNGSWINGAAVTGRAPLESGDEVRLGVTRLLFLLVPDAIPMPNIEALKSPRTDPLADPVIPGSRTFL